MASQNEAGVWVIGDDRMGTMGDLIRAPCWELQTILRYIETARMTLGEIDAVPRGRADPRATAYPYADWCDVDWERC